MRASLDVAVETLARTQHCAFSIEQACELGMSRDSVRRRIAAGRYERATDRVCVLPHSPRTYEQRVMVACLHAGPAAFASHDCGAMLRGLDGVTSAPVEITVPRGVRTIPPHAVVHTSTDCLIYDRTAVNGIPTATTTRILVDMAARAELDLLERMYECGVRRGETSKAQIAELVERLARSGKAGINRARELLEIVVDDGRRNGSDLETLYFQLLRAAGLPLPERQRVIYDEQGRILIADYAYAWIDALIELLGYEWHSSSAALNRDAERANYFNLEGKIVIEFTWRHVTREPEYVIATMRRLLAR